MQYEFCLPVYKQGDDFDGFMGSTDNDHVKSLRLLGHQYQCAADMCKTLASRIIDNDLDVEMGGATHWIWVSSDTSLDDLCVSQGDSPALLTVLQLDEEEDFESDADFDEIAEAAANFHRF